MPIKFTSRKRGIRAQTLTESVTGLIFIIGAIVLGVIAIVNAGVLAYYQGKTNLIANQAALYAASLSAGDPNAKQEIATQIAPLYKIMNLPTPPNFGQKSDQSIIVDSTTTPGVVSVTITISNLQPIYSIFSGGVPILMSSTSKSAAFTSDTADSSSVGLIAIGTQSPSGNNSALFNATMAAEADYANFASLQQQMQNEIPIADANPGKSPAWYELQSLGQQSNAAQTQLGKDQAAQGAADPALGQLTADGQALNQAQNTVTADEKEIKELLTGGPSGLNKNPSPPISGNPKSKQAQLTADKTQLTQDQQALANAQSKYTQDESGVYSYVYSYVPIAGIGSSSTSPPPSSSVANKPVYKLGSVALVYPTVVNAVLPEPTGSNINVPINYLTFPAGGANTPSPFYNQTWYYGSPFSASPGLPVYFGLQQVTSSLSAFGPSIGDPSVNSFSGANANYVGGWPFNWGPEGPCINWF